MSDYDINDPRNSNSPFNLMNWNSPFYNPKQAADQSGAGFFVYLVLGIVMACSYAIGWVGLVILGIVVALIYGMIWWAERIWSFLGFVSTSLPTLPALGWWWLVIPIVIFLGLVWKWALSD